MEEGILNKPLLKTAAKQSGTNAGGLLLTWRSVR